MTWITKRRVACSVAVTVLIAPLPIGTGPVAADVLPALPHLVAAAHSLPLGPANLTELRTTTTLQPGVTLTTIVRGTAVATQAWTVEINVPATSTSPDPDAPPAALSDHTSAEVLAGRLRAAGFDPRVEEVKTPATADYAGGRLGWRVRAGRFTDKAAADALLTQLVAAGYAGASRFTGWDGRPTDRGPWRLQVLTINPQTLRGSLLASYGPTSRTGRPRAR